ncbi:MAG: hypothetical protein M5R36_10830 [Deltaproteobacteria bacterium]|nr:hypothetical protein [Deltaproteobacteria bacterium]
MRQFDEFQASTLFCPRCKQAVPVREVLLLVLPGKTCTTTGAPNAARRSGKRRARTA